MFHRLRTAFFPALVGACIALSPGASTALAGGQDQFECRGESTVPAVAQKLLGDVESSYRGLQTLRAAFIQDSYMAALDVSERSSGEMVFVKPGRMRWDYRSPEEQTFLVRDTTVWFYQPQAKQVLIDEFRDVLISDLPVAFLMGLGGLSDKFEVARACVDGAGVVFELRPRGAGADEGLKGFILKVDEKRLPVGARVVDVGGNETTIFLTDRKPNLEVAESLFKAEFPAGTDINDQRAK
jgi:outer membrane lipoprotein carrier protein